MLEIIVKCREAVSSEVKSLKWSEKLYNVEGSEVQESEVKWTKQSKVEWGEVKCSIGKGGGDESLWKRFIGVLSDEKWRTGAKTCVN